MITQHPEMTLHLRLQTAEADLSHYRDQHRRALENMENARERLRAAEDDLRLATITHNELKRRQHRVQGS